MSLDKLKTPMLGGFTSVEERFVVIELREDTALQVAMLEAAAEHSVLTYGTFLTHGGTFLTYLRRNIHYFTSYYSKTFLFQYLEVYEKQFLNISCSNPTAYAIDF